MVFLFCFVFCKNALSFCSDVMSPISPMYLSVCPIICPADITSLWFSRCESGCFAFTAGGWQLLASAMNNWFPPEPRHTRAKGFYFQASPLENTTIDFSCRLFRTRDCTFVAQRLRDEERGERRKSLWERKCQNLGGCGGEETRIVTPAASRATPEQLTSYQMEALERKVERGSAVWSRLSMGSFHAEEKKRRPP